jgi:hypothetical protein
LTIGFDPEFADHLPLVDNSKNHALIQTKLAELGHPHAQVKFIKAEAPPREKVAAASLCSTAASAKVRSIRRAGQARPGSGAVQQG